MEKSGLVVSTSGDRAKVQLLKHTACGDCGACQVGKENLQLEIDAMNKAGAKAGDYVALNMETVDVMRAAAIIYFIPLVALVVGLFTGVKAFEMLGVAQFELAGLAVGVLLMAGAFLVIKKNEKKLHNDERYLTVITKVLMENELSSYDIEPCEVKLDYQED